MLGVLIAPGVPVGKGHFFFPGNALLFLQLFSKSKLFQNKKLFIKCPCIHIPCSSGRVGKRKLYHQACFLWELEGDGTEGSNCTISPPTGRQKGPELGRFKVQVNFMETDVEHRVQ